MKASDHLLFLLVLLALCFLYGGMTVGWMKQDIHDLQVQVEMLESRERDRQLEKTMVAGYKARMEREFGESGRPHIGWIDCTPLTAAPAK